MSRSKPKKRARYLIAIDGRTLYLRRTLCVNHDYAAGEIRYDSKHSTQSRAPKHIWRAFVAAYAALNGLRP